LKPSGRLFQKYAILIVSLVGVPLLMNEAINGFITFQEIRSGLLKLGREKAISAAERIESYVKVIERQIAWTALPSVVANGDSAEIRKLETMTSLGI
jgi:hypothetical protein